MSRVDNSDEQRIRELNEAAYRNKVDNEKRIDQSRAQRSFNEVMSQQASDQAKRKAVQKDSPSEERTRRPDGGAAQLKRGQKAVREGAATHVQATRATQNQAQLERVRGDLGSRVREAEFERIDEVTSRSSDERERISKKSHDEDVREFQRQEDQQFQQRVDPDDRNRQQGDDTPRRDRRERGEGEGGGQRELPGVQALDGPKVAQQVKIPTEVIEQIAKMIQVELAKGSATTVRISLAGTQFEGVTLRVSANKGQIRCVFEGCDKQTKNLIEASKGELMRGLARRGLELDTLLVR